MSNKNTYQLEECVKDLTRSFQRWDDIMKNGCTDPFYCDGMNLNLVRNHIIYHKKQIEELLEAEKTGQTSLFSSSYPDIYFKPTPEKVSYDFMVNPDGIRSRAAEQLALYEQNPDFCYICDHYKEVFPNGETKSTKASGIYPGKYARFTTYRAIVEKDELVAMRNLFRVPYEEHIKELTDCANELRAYLCSDHSHDDNTPIKEDYYDEEYEEVLPIKKTSLDEQIQVASAKAEKHDKPVQQEQEIQLSFFDF